MFKWSYWMMVVVAVLYFFELEEIALFTASLIGLVMCWSNCSLLWLYSSPRTGALCRIGGYKLVLMTSALYVVGTCSFHIMGCSCRMICFVGSWLKNSGFTTWWLLIMFLFR